MLSPLANAWRSGTALLYFYQSHNTPMDGDQLVFCVLYCRLYTSVVLCFSCAYVIATTLLSVCECCAISLDYVNCCNAPEETASSIRGRIPTRDHGKRSNAQTVTLKPKSVGRTVSGWGPIRSRMGWVLAANRVRHSTDTVLSCQSGPRLVTITQHRAR
jgi:hypothetical protein